MIGCIRVLSYMTNLILYGLVVVHSSHLIILTSKSMLKMGEHYMAQHILSFSTKILEKRIQQQLVFLCLNHADLLYSFLYHLIQRKATSVSRIAQKSRSLLGVETEPVLPVCLAEPLDHLNTLWNLVHICPTLLLEDVHPIGNASTWTAFQAFLTSDISNATVIGYGPFFPKSPTHPDVVEESVQYCRDVSSKLEQEFTIITCDQAIYEVVLGLQKIKPVKYDKVIWVASILPRISSERLDI